MTDPSTPDAPSIGAVLDELERKARAAAKTVSAFRLQGASVQPIPGNVEVYPATALALIEVARAAGKIADGHWTEDDGWSSVDTDLIDEARAALGRLTEGRAEP